jgi:poly-gamma-glutamate capsule biosynthesis protein CapA/YwtB (metallophosphatase superfamily)
MTQSDQVRLMFTGNSLIQHPLSVYREPRFLALVDLLNGADATFTNLEGVIQDGEDWPTHAAGNGRGSSPMSIAPNLIRELQWLGMKMVFAANNHATDFMEGGVLTTIRYLKAAGMPYAGIGANLTEATAPGYVETAHGRVGLVAASDWGPRGARDLPFPPPVGSFAADQSPQYRGRPGMNLLRYEADVHVDRDGYDALKRISEALGWEHAKEARGKGFGVGGGAEPLFGPTIFDRPDTADEMGFMGTRFHVGDEFSVTTTPYQDDLARNYTWIAEARKQADWVVSALHDQGNRDDEDADYVREFARGSIDAGADVFVAHAGRIGGIEIYRGKPIIYGLSTFIMQLHQLQRVPVEMMARRGLTMDHTPSEFVDSRVSAMKTIADTRVSGVASSASSAVEVVFDRDGTFREVRIHPLELTGGTRASQGRPMMAEPGSALSEQVLDVTARRSTVYGTKLETVDGVGIIRAV